MVTACRAARLTSFACTVRLAVLMRLWLFGTSRVAWVAAGSPARAPAPAPAVGAAGAASPAKDRWAGCELAAPGAPLEHPASSRPVPEMAAAMIRVVARSGLRRVRARAVAFM